MARCESCGNDYDKSFQILIADGAHTFDCFECAIHRLAPVCARCGCRIVGHGVEAKGTFYCGAHCATAAGEAGGVDRLG